MVGWILYLLVDFGLFFELGRFRHFLRILVVNKVLIECVCGETSFILSIGLVHGSIK